MKTLGQFLKDFLPFFLITHEVEERKQLLFYLKTKINCSSNFKCDFLKK